MGGYSGNVIILDFSKVAGVFCYTTYGYPVDLHGCEVNDHGTVDYRADGYGIDDATVERLVAA